MAVVDDANRRHARHVDASFHELDRVLLVFILAKLFYQKVEDVVPYSFLLVFIFRPIQKRGSIPILYPVLGSNSRPLEHVSFHSH